MRARAQRTFFAALFTAGTLLVNPDSTATETFAALDAELGAVVNDPAHPLASLSVLAVRDGEVVYQRQFGHRHIDPATVANSRPANQDTLYRVASISKLVTALGAMKLVEQGKLSLDADVGVRLGYPLRNPHFPSRPITLRMLLSHTSSLRDDAGYFWDARHTLKDLLVPGGSLHGSAAMWARNAPPGGYFSYANLNSAIVAALMELAGGERFDRLMQRLILVPMGLHGGFNPAEFSAAELNNLASLYRKRTEINGEEVWNSAGPWVAQVDDYSRAAPLPRAGPDYLLGSNGSLQSPQGNLRMSAADLGKIMRMLINHGKHEGRQILRPDTVAAMFAEQWRHDGQSGNGDTYRGLFHAWGLGNQHFHDLSAAGSGDRLVEDGGFTGVGHLGDAWGLTAAFVFDPATRNGAIYLIGGPGTDPETYSGRYSSRSRYEEKIMTALYRRAILNTDKHER